MQKSVNLLDPESANLRRSLAKLTMAAEQAEFSMQPESSKKMATLLTGNVSVLDLASL